MLQRRPSARSTTVMRGGAAGSGRPAAQATSVPLMMSSLAPPLSPTEKRRPVTRSTPRTCGAPASAPSASHTAVVPETAGDREIPWTSSRRARRPREMSKTQTTASDARDAVVWVFDISRGRRARLEDVQGLSRSPAVSGTTAVWEADGAEAGAPQVRGVDLVTGRRFSVGESGGASELIISGTLVAWAAGRPDPAAPPLITVVDLADGRRWSIAPYPQNQGSDLLGIALAGRTLIWARATAARADQILAYDLDRTAVRAIAQAADLVPPAARDRQPGRSHGPLYGRGRRPGSGRRVRRWHAPR